MGNTFEGTPFMTQLKHLLKWLPIIWQDRDWDWAYWAQLNSFKLQQMYDCLTGPKAVGLHDPDKLADILALKALFDNLSASTFEDAGLENGDLDKIDADFKAVIDSIAEILKNSLLHWWD